MAVKKNAPTIPFRILDGSGNWMDRYMSADEKLLAVAQQLNHIAEVVEGQIGGAMQRGRTEEIVFQQVLAPGAGIRLVQPMPFPGYIKKILRHWPNGCNALVDIAVGVGNKHILPESGFVALNDATPVFDNLAVYVNQAEQIWVDLQNGDAANAHTVTVTVTVEEVILASS